jgi:hypothetical protein
LAADIYQPDIRLSEPQALAITALDITEISAGFSRARKEASSPASKQKQVPARKTD